MGSSNQTIEQISLKSMTEEILEENKFKIKDYFDSFEIEKNKPNNIPDLNGDRPIIKNISPKENRYQLNIDIYNLPALFRVDNGLFSIVSQISIYLDLFKGKYSHMNEIELKQRFSLFFKSLLELNSEEINKLINLKITKNDLIGIKHGMEKLIDYFGIENINYFVMKLVYISGFSVIGAIFGLSMSIVGNVALSTSVLSGIGIGIIIGFIGFVIWRESSNKLQKEKLEKSQKNIQKFFEEIKTISKDKFHNKNLFIISIKKNKQNINDICLFPWLIENYNSQNCPLIGAHETADSNSDYYSTLIDGIEFYLEIYSQKIYNYLNNNYQGNFINELKKDISFLKSASKQEIRKRIKKKETPIKSNSGINNNHSYSNYLPEVPKQYDDDIFENEEKNSRENPNQCSN